MLQRLGENMSAYESMKRGLIEAIARAEGKKANARVHQTEVPEVDLSGRCSEVEN